MTFNTVVMMGCLESIGPHACAHGKNKNKNAAMLIKGKQQMREWKRKEHIYNICAFSEVLFFLNLQAEVDVSKCIFSTS